MRIDEFKAMIQEIVSEELDNMLLTERVAGTRKTRKKGTPKAGRGTFTSAGTIPYKMVNGKKVPASYAKKSMSGGQVSAREKIGTKMLNAVNRSNKDPKAARFRTGLERTLQKQGLPADKPHLYSKIWSAATAIAKRGGTDWNISKKAKAAKKAKSGGKAGGKAKSKSSTKKSATPTPQTPQQPSSGNTPE